MKKIEIFDYLNIFKRKPDKIKTSIYMTPEQDKKLSKIVKKTKYSRSDALNELLDKFNMDILERR